MAEDMLAIIRSQIERLREESESMSAERAIALQTVSECEQAVTRNEAKIEALEEVLAAADSAECEGQERDQPRAEPPEFLGNGKAKIKATAAIFGLIDQKGRVSRDQLMGLADQIDSEAEDKRHILQTTVYTLKKKGKLAEDEDGWLTRPRRAAH